MKFRGKGIRNNRGEEEKGVEKFVRLVTPPKSLKTKVLEFYMLHE